MLQTTIFYCASIPCNCLVTFKINNHRFQVLLHNNTPKIAILGVKIGPKMSKLCLRLSRYLEKYLEFLRSEKSSEISETSSIRINKLAKKVSDPPYTLKDKYTCQF